MPTQSPRIVFHVGGPSFHPVADQAKVIASWLGEGYQCAFHHGVDAFDELGSCDLLVLMGLHWTAMPPEAGPYRPMTEAHRRSLQRYVHSGRPIIAHHGAIASYDDCPSFGEMIGIRWEWGVASHSPIDWHTVNVKPTNHPVVAGVGDFRICDELYYNLRITHGMPHQVHASATWNGDEHPMVISFNRIDGGRSVYLANGHDLRAFEAPAMRQIWVNSVQWVLHR